MTSEVAGYQTWGDGRGIEGCAEGGGKLDAGIIQPPHSRTVTRRDRSRTVPRFNSLPIYLRVSFYFYLRSVYFLIHVFWRFVVTIGSDVVIFTVSFAADDGIL